MTTHLLYEAPHAARNLPKSISRQELRSQLDPNISKAELRGEVDRATRVFYPQLGVLKQASDAVIGTTPKWLLDLNRFHPGILLPEENQPLEKDGILKKQTQFAQPIWRNEDGPNRNIRNILQNELKNYRSNFREKICQALQSEDDEVFIWCMHTFPAASTNSSTISNNLQPIPDYDATKRPLIEVANGGDINGENWAANGAAAELIQTIAEKYKSIINLLEFDRNSINEDYPVGINHPYGGKTSIERLPYFAEGIVAPQNVKGVLTEIRQDLGTNRHNVRVIRRVNLEIDEMIRDYYR
jgi:hypothetical protein